MPKLAANLSWIYQEVPFLQRFGAAASHGFKAVEILFPYEAPAREIAAELKKHKLTQALFNLPPGDWSKGERGVAALFPITAHVQIAGNPERNEPDAGEANHLYLLDVLDRLGYQGYVGLEYKPRTTTAAGLGWAKKYGIEV